MERRCSRTKSLAEQRIPSSQRDSNNKRRGSVYSSHTKRGSVYSLAEFADKRRADSVSHQNNTNSMEICEEDAECPAVVVNVIYGLTDCQECDVEMEDGDVDGDQHATTIKANNLLSPPSCTALNEEDEEEEKDSLEDDEVFSQGSQQTDSRPLPNINLPCTQCGEVINICLLPAHRSLHDALRRLRYAYEQKPQSLQSLVNRRRRLIKVLQESNRKKNKGNIVDKQVHVLNTAFEIIKAHVEGRPHMDEIEVKNPRTKGRVLHMACSMAVGLCVEGNESWKHMEDAHAYYDSFLEGTQSSFLGIYDGYCGRTTARQCAECLHVFLKEELDDVRREKNNELSRNDVGSAFKRAYAETEKTLITRGEEERSPNRWSGCSAVTCILTPTTCYLANLGNVGAMLLRSNDVVRVLTRSHDLYDKRERDRVRKTSAVIVKTDKCALVNGALRVTRGIGNIGDGALRSCVINEPRVKSARLEETDQLIVLASSGLWRTFSYEEVVYLIEGFFQQIRVEVKKYIVSKRDSASAVGKKSMAAHAAQRRRHSSALTVLSAQGDRDREDQLVSSISLIEDRLEWSRNDTTGTSPHSNVSSYFEPAGNATVRQSKRRRSLPNPQQLQQYLQTSALPQLKPIKEKAGLLAKSISERLVRSAVLAGSKDNITVFVVLLPGFCRVDLGTLVPSALVGLTASLIAPGSEVTDSRQIQKRKG